MDWIRTINSAIAYMEEHLTERIELEDIAKSVRLSPFHFHRAFSMLTEMSPVEYLRKRRLSQAGAELANGQEKIIDVALKYGYDTRESFTKAFTRYHGVSPMQATRTVSFRSTYTEIVLNVLFQGDFCICGREQILSLFPIG